ncbi:efflux RND transporter periplasmic adaptor subunit [Pandoraea sputorum]|uniref:efflux RND transporter periplasmic adaptor subunit n=1 Tax=Pandoraea sputorum TaxID=93222 RepID=UPI001242F562|nr:efflux RND transporter periplasmic adaptor subunit [Pandoraea sputorum]VVE77284.1 Multidrug resistance protein MdtA [Pandoraea sputorum]
MPSNRIALRYSVRARPPRPRTIFTRPSFYLLACYLSLTFLASCGRRETPPPADIARPVKVFTVASGDASSPRDFSGRVERTNVSPLAFQIPGRVVAIPVLDGRRVTKGQLLAQLDAEPFELQVRRAEAQYAQLSADMQRKSALHTDGILSDGAFEQLKSAWVSAGVARDLARRDLRNTRLVAPFDGRILQRNIEMEQTVQAGAPVMSIEAAHRTDIGIELPQNIVERLPPGTALRAQAWTPDRPDEPFELKYRESSVTTGPQGSSYRLIFTVASPASERLLPGMAVRVRLLTPLPTGTTSTTGGTNTGPEGQWTLPFSALTAAPDGAHRVWRIQGAERRVHAITVRPQEIHDADGTVAVTGALSPGDMIVAAGAAQLKEGDAVRPLGASQ